MVRKPAGISSQSTSDFEEDMVSLIKNHLPAENGEPYVGVVHRLDKMVPGVMVYAKNREAAAALSAQVAKGSLTKIYHASVSGKPRDKKGELVDYLVKDDKENISRVCDAKTKGAKQAKLRYRVIESRYDGRETVSRIEAELLTGRHHQIRVQFSAHGMPILGDRKYNPKPDDFDRPQLEAVSLEFIHPRTKKPMKFGVK